MNIVVCINSVPDPEAPPKQFKLDEATNRPAVSHLKRVIGPFDENALEVALQLKDAIGAKVTAMTVGPAANADALKRALAVKCDGAVHLKEDGAGDLDSAGIAALLAAGIRKLGEVDLVLCGREVGDWDSGQVGQLLSEELGFACVALATDVEAGNEGLRVTKEIAGGVAVIAARTPAVVTVTNTPSNQLRIPKVKDVMAAHRAPITNWAPASDLGIDVSRLRADSRVTLHRMFIPSSTNKVDLVQGENDEQTAELLAKRILDLKIL